MSRAASTASTRSSDPYALPEYYDLINAQGTHDQASALVRIAKRFVGKDAIERLWLEPACGTARLLRALAKLRVRTLVGVDLHAAMLAYGERVVRADTSPASIRLVKGDMTKMKRVSKPGSVGVAFCLDNSVRHLLTDVAMLAHLRCIKHLLAPDGIYIVGIGLSPDGGEFPVENVWHARRGDLRLTQTFEFIPPMPGTPEWRKRIEHAHAHLLIRKGATMTDDISSYILRTYTLAQWQRLIARSGLREIAVVNESSRLLDPSRTMYAFRVLARNESHSRAKPAQRSVRTKKSATAS